MKKKSTKKRIKNYGLIFIIGLILSINYIGFYLYGYNLAYKNLTTQIEPKQRIDTIHYQPCFNQTLINTTMCMVEFVEFIYNYTERTDVIRPIEDIKKNGGDCFDYNKIYEEMAYYLGFNAHGVALSSEKNSGHYIVIVSNEEGYCYLDQIANPVCSLYSQGVDKNG